MSAEASTRLRQALIRHTPITSRTEPRLQAALAHLALHPGKLLRAHLTLTAAEAHGLDAPSAEAVACAVEFFHIASLVLDDLPCMDDATLRRGQVCVHRTFGEATAILAALALINRAYALVGRAFAGQRRAAREEAIACLERNLGTAGLVGGQAWDLTFGATNRSATVVSRIAAAKTGALFSLCLLLPAVAARRSKAERRHLHALAVYWGQEFQIVDDLRDVLSSTVESGKTTQRDRVLARPNFAVALGVPAARRRLTRLARQAERALTQLESCHGERWSYLRPFRAALDSAAGILTGQEIVAA